MTEDLYSKWKMTPWWLRIFGLPAWMRSRYASAMIGGGWDGWEFQTEEMRMSSETYSYYAPICPYCGHQHEHDGGYFYDENMSKAECESCGKEFAVSVSNSWTWTCERIDTTGSPESERESA